MKKHSLMGRRGFLKAAAAGVLGAGLPAKKIWSSPGESGEKEALKIKKHRILGRTGFSVSDIGCGYSPIEAVTAAMLDAGINYIDTAEQYPGHHKLLSGVIKGRNRKDIFISSKLEVKQGEGADNSREAFVKRTRKCLEELGTDYIDCMMMHMPEKKAILKTPGFHEAMQQLKSEGRIRFSGVSHHGSFWFKDPEESMGSVLGAAVEDGRFDVFLLAYNFLQMDQGEKILHLCREKKIGTTLMKTTPVAKYYLMKNVVARLEKEKKEVHPLYVEGVKRFKKNLDSAEPFIKKFGLQNPEEIKEAAIRFVLDNPDVNTVCCAARTFEEADMFIGLSGSGLNSWDRAKLAAYREGCGALYCRHACGLCEPSCPHGVPVNTIMRYSHYFTSQGREKEAMEKYAAIPGADAGKCGDCTGKCENNCPYGVPIQGMLLAAHRLMSLKA